MLKQWFVVILLVAVASCKSDKKVETGDKQGLSVAQMPALHVIKEHTFMAPFDCGGNSHEHSGLFLTDKAKVANHPHLLLNGLCATKPYFSAMFHDTDYAFLTDLGNVPLADVTVKKAFNFSGAAGKDSAFKREVPMDKDHTYAAILSRKDTRVLFAFRVISHGGTAQAMRDIKIQYVVKDYMEFSPTVAPDFSIDR